MNLISKENHVLLKSLVEKTTIKKENDKWLRRHVTFPEINKGKTKSEKNYVSELNKLTKRVLTKRQIGTKEFYNQLLNMKFHSKDDCKHAFHCWFELTATTDIKNALYLDIQEDPDGKLNELRLSIIRGKTSPFPFEDFIQTENGLIHKMLI